MNSLIQESRLLGAGTREIRVVTCRQRRAGSDNPAIVGVKTVLHGVFQNRHIPTIHEIAMEAVSRWVTVGKHEFSPAGLVDQIGEV